MENIFAELDDIFNEVKDQDGGFTELPDGEYLVKVLGAELTTSKTSGKPMVKTAFGVEYGEHTGSKHTVFHVLTGATLEKTKGAINRFARFAKELGVGVDGGLENTIKNVDALKGQTYKMTIETNDGWKNTSFTK